MTKQIITCEPDVTVLQAAKIMAKNDVGCLIVVDEGKAVGIVTERDLLKKVTATGMSPSRARVSKIMSSPVLTVNPGDSVRRVAKLMRDNNIRRLVVVSGGKLRGVITVRDITDAIIGTMAELSTPAE